MKKLLLFSLVVLLFSCQDKEAIRKENALKAAQKTEETYNAISKSWRFYNTGFSPEALQATEDWMEWNSFITELQQKPQTDIGAFQKKTKKLVEKAEALSTTIPPVFNKIQIQSRIDVLITKFKMLNTYIHLDDIPVEKVLQMIDEINTDLASIVSRMETILEKSRILQEEGENEMLRMMNDSLRQQP